MLRNSVIRDRDYRRLFAGAAFHQTAGSVCQHEATGTTAVGAVLAIYFVPFFVFGLRLCRRRDRPAHLAGDRAGNRRRDLRVCRRRWGGSTALLIAAFVVTGSRALHQPVRLATPMTVGEKNLFQ